MKLFRPLVGFAAAFAVSMSAASALVIENFESYSQGEALGDGGDPWNYTGAVGGFRATPDPSNSGYTFVISGSRSAFISSGIGSLDFSDFGGLSWGNSDTVLYSSLVSIPDSLGSTARLRFTLSPTSGLGTGAAVWLYNDGTGARFWTDGAAFVDTGVSVITGGGGAPTLNQVYRTSMAVDFSNNTFESFYEDVTNNPGVDVSLGSQGMNLFGGSTDTGTSYLAIGNIHFQSSGAAAGIDEIDVSVVPEPQAIALLALSGLFLLKGSRRRDSLS